jgi:putative ABC transport system substrate-binding protein
MAPLLDSGSTFGRVETAAKALGFALQNLAVREPAEFPRAFEAAGVGRADALFVTAQPFTNRHRAQILDLAAKQRLPAMYTLRGFVEAGGLMAYGPSLAHQYRRAATYVDLILEHGNAADLPVEQPTKFELVVNLKTARALGLTIPPALLLRADQVIAADGDPRHPRARGIRGQGASPRFTWSDRKQETVSDSPGL